MHKNTADGQTMTLDEHVDHTRWPCVPHVRGVPCELAQRVWRDPREMRLLKPQEIRRDRHPEAPR